MKETRSTKTPQAAHTPGPWKVGPQPNGCIRGTEHLKSVWAEKPGSLNGDRVEYNVAENCDEANARLIAAAPDLLAALRKAVKDAPPRRSFNCPEWVHEADDAIARAEGR